MAIWVVLLLSCIVLSLAIALKILVFKPRDNKESIDKKVDARLVNFLILRVILSIILLATCYYYLSAF